MIAKKKPWGYEYLIYQNDEVAIWHLFIDKWQKTSLHCHPNKKTGLLVLCGGGEVRFLNGKQKVFTGDKVMIRHGLFHQTKNMTSETLQLFEIETPVDKADIVRLEDSYGRAGTPYGLEDEVDIDFTELIGAPQAIGDCEVSITNINSPEDLGTCELVMIVRGGIYFNEHQVAGPGDILNRQTFYSLSEKFSIHPSVGVLITSCMTP